MTDTGASRPRGPEAVSIALLAACEQLCSQSPPGSVTVRAIADAADVNHGLVHHYFDSKIALLGATMQHVEEGMVDALTQSDDPAASAGAFIDAVIERPSYPRLLSWMLLEGVDPTDHIDHFPLVDKLIGNVRTITTAGEARLRVFILLTFVAGLATTSDFMAEATGLTTSERERTRARGKTTAIAIVTPPVTHHT